MGEMEKSYFKPGKYLEAGLDEVARGCLAGPVYTAAVIWPSELEPEEQLNEYMIKDSKKLNRKKREIVRPYIEENAIDFSVASVDNKRIDVVNIRNATFEAMHIAIHGLDVEPEILLIDGDGFRPYYNTDGNLLEHKCIIQGDNTYISIAAASILAKVYHDNYITKICEDNPDYNIYGWKNNMCYGASQHMNAIKDWGITPLHRKTFGICSVAGNNDIFRFK